MEEESPSKDHQISNPSPIGNLDDPDSEDSNNSPDNELNELNILEEDLLCVVCRYFPLFIFLELLLHLIHEVLSTLVSSAMPCSKTWNYKIFFTSFLFCCKLRQMMQSDGNRLVECQECHGLYHQECHQPPINEAEIPVNDPRLAWYCTTCKKKLNKAVSFSLTRPLNQSLSIAKEIVV